MKIPTQLTKLIKKKVSETESNDTKFIYTSFTAKISSGNSETEKLVELGEITPFGTSVQETSSASAGKREISDHLPRIAAKRSAKRLEDTQNKPTIDSDSDYAPDTVQKDFDSFDEEDEEEAGNRVGGAKAWRSRDKRRYEMRELTSDDEVIETPAKRRSKRSQLSYYTGEDDGDPDAYRARIQ